MRTTLIIASMAGLLLTAGCASTPLVGNGVSRADQFFGDVGITGSGSVVTILRGSRVNKLSILGNDCSVTVEDGVRLYKIEFWGKNNTVSIPEYLIVRTAEVGTNQIIRRPREVRPPADESRWEPPPIERAPESSSYRPRPVQPESRMEASPAPASDEWRYRPPPTMQPENDSGPAPEEL